MVKTFAVLSDVYQPSHGNEELASVYIPGTPDPSNGFLRVVPTDKLVYVDWALKDLLRYHLSFGATGPPLNTESDGTNSEL